MPSSAQGGSLIGRGAGSVLSQQIKRVHLPHLLIKQSRHHCNHSYATHYTNSSLFYHMACYQIFCKMVWQFHQNSECANRSSLCIIKCHSSVLPLFKLYTLLILQYGFSIAPALLPSVESNDSHTYVLLFDKINASNYLLVKIIFIHYSERITSYSDHILSIHCFCCNVHLLKQWF